jgi:DNA-directed RNA polymerase specialized sigma24 family protein
MSAKSLATGGRLVIATRDSCGGLHSEAGKEKSLLARCIRGDKASWDAFVLQYSALVYHTLRKTFGLHHAKLNDDVIEDLYQEFFVSILREDFKKLRQFKGNRGCTLASWLRLVAARMTIDFFRGSSGFPMKKYSPRRHRVRRVGRNFNRFGSNPPQLAAQESFPFRSPSFPHAFSGNPGETSTGPR